MSVRRKLPYTPSSHIRHALRQLTQRGREKNEALKAAGRCCQVCGVKHSRAKGREVTIEMHHERRPDWERVIRVVREELLAGPWRALCVECHAKAEEHEQRAQEHRENRANTGSAGVGCGNGCACDSGGKDARALTCCGRTSR